jgi:hypothetical protein
VPTAAPIGRWFRIEAFMHKAADSTGKIEFFLDGVSLLKSENVSTVPNDWLYWVVGGASNKITEQPAIVYLDDAAILRDGPGM